MRVAAEIGLSGRPGGRLGLVDRNRSRFGSNGGRALGRGLLLGVCGGSGRCHRWVVGCKRGRWRWWIGCRCRQLGRGGLQWSGLVVLRGGDG